MNWEIVGAIAEAVGAIAVLATLLYLALQVKNARSEFGFWATQDTRVALRELFSEPIRSPELRKVFVKLSAVDQSNSTSFEQVASEAGIDIEERIIFGSYQVLWISYLLQLIESIDFFSSDQRERVDEMISNQISGLGRLWYVDWKKRNPDHLLSRYIDEQALEC